MSARMSVAELREWQAKSMAAKATGMVSRGREKPTGMNQTEADYAALLQARMIAGEVQWFRYEGVKLRLADDTFYTPDFFLMLTTSELEVHEVKGHWEDDARVKIKVAATMYPFRFIAVTKIPLRQGGGFKREVFE